MTRIDGLLIVDKPQRMSSLDVVRVIKARFNIRKAGHIGTLDPFATGVLPIVLNEGTKLVPFLQEEPKEYEAVMRLGEETSTDDLTGEVVRSGSLEGITSEIIREVIRSFSGRIRQVPPMFSAVKVKGRPLYQLARKGIEIERGEREVEVFDIEIQNIDLPNVHFRVCCSKGTYIRALSRDIGKRIGCGGHLILLRRTRSGPFALRQAVSLEKLREMSGRESLLSFLIPLKEALSGLPELVGDEQMVRKVRYGMEMVARDLHAPSLPLFEKDQWLRMSSSENELVAILKSELKRGEVAKADPGRIVLRPIRIFHHEKIISKGDHI